MSGARPPRPQRLRQRPGQARWLRNGNDLAHYLWTHDNSGLKLA